MRIGNRLFPYPTLNNNTELSEYREDSVFGITFDNDDNGELLKNENGQILKNIHFELNNSRLVELFNKGDVKCTLIVESPASNYRVYHDINMVPKDITISNADLKGTVSVSAYLWANTDIKDYVNESFSEIYSGYKFDIDKYDILAIDDGFKFQVDFDPLEDNKMPSIFTVVPKDSYDNNIEYQNRGKQIVIMLPVNYYKKYDMK